MKKHITLAFIAGSLFFTSCNIVVDPGYDPAARVAGSYWVEEYSQTYDEYTNYEISISQRGYSTVLISNFYGVNLSVNAEVSGNTLYIPFQVRNGYEIEGRATIISGKLNFTYSVRDTYDVHWVRNVCSADAWAY